jgi:hypothetical protein
VNLRLYLRDRLRGHGGTPFGASWNSSPPSSRAPRGRPDSRLYPSPAGPSPSDWVITGWPTSGPSSRTRGGGLRPGIHCPVVPWGRGALAGSTLPLDRHATSWELGFQGPTQTAWRPGQRDSTPGHPRLLAWEWRCTPPPGEDLILYATQEFGWLRLSDGFCTGSSMMPQKKNPDVRS